MTVTIEERRYVTTTDPVLLEISALALALHPRELLLRIHDWRSNGFGAGGMSEQVSRSSTYPIPVTQPTDKEGNPIGPPRSGDAMDRELQQAARSYKDCIDDAVRLLRTASALETKYLFEITVASEDLRELVSDNPTCMCGDTREVWERRKNKSRWRIKAGFGPCCYSAWNSEGSPDKVQWLRARRADAAVSGKQSEAV